MTSYREPLNVYRVTPKVKLDNYGSVQHFLVCEVSEEQAQQRMPNGLCAPELIHLQTLAMRCFHQHFDNPSWFLDKLFMEKFFKDFHVFQKLRNSIQEMQEDNAEDNDEVLSVHYPVRYIKMLKAFLMNTSDIRRFPMTVFLNRCMDYWVPSLDLVDVEFIAELPKNHQRSPGEILAYCVYQCQNSKVHCK